MDVDYLRALYYSMLPLSVNAIVALIIVVVGWFVGRWVKSLLLVLVKTSRVDKTFGNFLASFAEYTVIIIAVVAALGTIGIQTASLVAIFASAGLALALALKNTLGDLAGGMIILLFRPFKLGDHIKSGEYEGEVKEVGLFMTTIVTENNTQVILPNAQITKTAVEKKL